MHYLVHYLATNHHEVLCIQSLNCRPQNLPTIGGYYYPPTYGLHPGTNRVGTAIYVHQGITYSKVPLSLKEVSQTAIANAVEIQGQDSTFKIANIYYPTKDPDFLWADKFHTPGWLVVGDFNCHSQLWDDRYGGPEPTQGLMRLTESQLVLLNDGSITRLPDRQGDSPSAIDLSFASPELAADVDWAVGEDPMSSDHLPIIINLAFGPRKDFVPHIPMFQYDKADWESFRMSLRTKEIEAPSALAVSELYLKIKDNLLAAAEASIPRSKPPRPNTRNNPWWNAACETAVAAKRAACKRYRKCANATTHTDMLVKKAASNRIVAMAKKEHWEHYMTEVGEDTPLSDVYKKMKQMRQRYVLPDPPMRRGDQVFTTGKEKAEAFADFIAANSKNESLPPEVQCHKTQYEKDHPLETPAVDEEDPLNLPITMTELRRAMSAIAKVKVSEGADGTSYRMLRELPTSYMDYLLILFQRCWAEGDYPTEWKHAIVTPIPKKGKPRQDLGSYRPISLTSHMGKIYERIVKDRLEHFCHKQGVIPVCQAGFRKGRSVTDHLVKFSMHARKALSRKHPLLSCFFDIKRAYDSVWHHRLLEKVRRLGINGRMYNFIRLFLSNRTIQVRWKGFLSSEKELQMGVPQGSVIAPLLFTIMLHDVTKIKLDGSVLTLYADDIALWRNCSYHLRARNFERNSRGAAEFRKFQAQVDAIAEYLRENGMILAPDKTQFMVVSRGQLPVLKLTVCGTVIAPVKSVKYLGVIFDKLGNMTQHINSNIAASVRAVNLIKILASQPWANHPNLMVTLVQSLVRSRLLFGLETSFEQSKTMRDKLERAECKALKIALGLPRATPRALTYREAGILPIGHVLQQRCATYIFRAQTVPNSIGPELKDRIPTLKKMIGVQSIQAYTKELVAAAGVENTEPATRPKHPYPPWILERPSVNLDMAGLRKSDNPLYIEQTAREYINKWFQYTLRVYTDGSVDDTGAGAAFCIPEMGKISRRYHLPKLNIFTVELVAILMALNYISELPQLPMFVTVLSDSLSALAAIERDGKSSREDVVIEILSVAHQLEVRGCAVQLQWVPAHVGLAGNELADRAAKAAAANRDAIPVNMTFALADIKGKLTKAIWRKWVEEFAAREDSFGAVDPGLPTKGRLLPRSIPTHLCRFIHRMRCGVWKTIYVPKPCTCGAFISPHHVMLMCPSHRNHFRPLVDKLQQLGLEASLQAIFKPVSGNWDLAVLAAKLTYCSDVAAYLQ